MASSFVIDKIMKHCRRKFRKHRRHKDFRKLIKGLKEEKNTLHSVVTGDLVK